MIEAAILHRDYNDVFDSAIFRIRQRRKNCPCELLAPRTTGTSGQQGSRGQPGVLQQLAAIDSHDALRGLKDFFRAFAAAPRGREKDGDWRINHPDKLTIGCKPEVKSRKKPESG